MRFIPISCPSRSPFTPYAAFHDEELKSRMVDDEQLRNQNTRLLGGIFPGHINGRLWEGETTYSEYIGCIRGGRNAHTQISINTNTLFCNPVSSSARPVDFAQQLMVSFRIAERLIAYRLGCYFVRASYLDKWEIVELLFDLMQRLNEREGKEAPTEPEAEIHRIGESLMMESIL